RTRVDQIAQLLLAEQLAQEIAVERQRLRAAFRRRGVVFVHVRRDVVEEKRRRIRRRGRRLDVDDIELARSQSLQQALERRQVEDGLQTLAIRLEDGRERAVLARDLQQPPRLQ